MKRRIIIGIHGLGNKPPQPLLRKWWQKAICEGLRRIGGFSPGLNFKLVYWAHFLYSEPQDICQTNDEHPLHIDHPYIPGPKEWREAAPSRLTKHIHDTVDTLFDRFFMTENRIFNFDRIGDYILRKKFRDLELYYHKDNVSLGEVGLHAQDMIRNTLVNVLKANRKKEIMLISHSMGTVIAYDVLTQRDPQFKIHTLITLGSPLGLPTIMKKIYSEQNRDFRLEKTLPTPETITEKWINLSDLGDRIAMNYTLRDEFAPNSRGVAPEDVIVNNDYEFQHKPNRHKSYGYLRTPELAQVIQDFIAGGRLSGQVLLHKFVRKIWPSKKRGPGK